MSCAGIPLSEPKAVPDDFVCGIDHIQTVGGSCARFVLYTEDYDSSGTCVERVVVRKIVISHENIGKAIRKVLRYAALRGIEIGRSKISKIFQGQSVH